MQPILLAAAALAGLAFASCAGEAAFAATTTCRAPTTSLSTAGAVTTITTTTVCTAVSPPPPPLPPPPPPSPLQPPTPHPVACANDGRAGAPAGAVALFPSLTAGKPFAPTCAFPDRDYGVGPTGLGAPAASVFASSPGTNVVHFGAGGIPAYFEIGQWLVDLSDEKGETIPPGTTIAALNAPSGDVTLSANLAATANAGDQFGAFNDIATAATPGWSKDAANGILSCHSPSPASNLSGIAALDWQIDVDAGCDDFVISNVYIALGTVRQRGQINENAGAGGAISNVWINERGLPLNPGVGQGAIQIASGAVSVTYTRLSRVWIDCLDGGGTVAGTTVSVKFSSCIDNGQGGTSVHGDVFQNFGAAGTSIAPTFQHNSVILTGDGPDTTQGMGCGDGSALGSCVGPTFTDNLLYTNHGQPNYWCLGVPSETTGVASCANNFALPGRIRLHELRRRSVHGLARRQRQRQHGDGPGLRRRRRQLPRAGAAGARALTSPNDRQC